MDILIWIVIIGVSLIIMANKASKAAGGENFEELVAWAQENKDKFDTNKYDALYSKYMRKLGNPKIRSTLYIVRKNALTELTTARVALEDFIKEQKIVD